MGPGNDMSSEDGDLRFEDPDTGDSFRTNYDLFKSQIQARQERELAELYYSYSGVLEPSLLDPIELIQYAVPFGIIKKVGWRLAATKLAPKKATTLDLLKNAKRTNSGALKVDNSTLQQIGSAEARGGKAFSSLQERTVQSKPATWQGTPTGGQQTVNKYVDPATGQTRFTVHTVTDSSGRVVHRDFDSVLIQSGQQVVK
jgi:hypothetical protein